MNISKLRIIVQSDWNRILLEPNGHAWLSVKRAGQGSVYGELTSRGVSTSGDPYVITAAPFFVENVSKKSIKLKYDSENEEISHTFQAASAEFEKIHKKHVSIQSIDTTTGGLGVSCNNQSELTLWETESGTVRRELSGHYGDVYVCRFFPSGEVVLSGGADMQAKIWSINGTCAATLTGHRAGVTSVGFVDRGRNVVTASRDGTAKLWSCAKQHCIYTFDQIEGQEVNDLEVMNTDVDLGTASHQPDEKEVLTDGKLLLVGCENHTLQGWGLHTRKKVFSIDCGSPVNCCSSLSSHVVVCGTQDSKLHIVDIRNTSEPVAVLEHMRSHFLSIRKYKQGFFASTGDGSCVYFSANDYQPTLEYSGPDCDPVYSVSATHQYVYTACRDGIVRKYTAPT